MKKINYNSIIKKISYARKKNNENWMKLLKIAFKFAPQEAKKIMSSINLEDKKISKLVEKLNKI